MDGPPLIDFQDTSQDDQLGAKVVEKAKKSPFLVASLVSLVTICGIGAYKWKTKTIPTSIFLIQLRVAAQGTAIGCLAVGMTYQMLQDFVFKDDKKKE